MVHPAAGTPGPRPPDQDRGRLLAGLTPEQAAAARHGAGPLLVIAGPGSGKTRTLIHRIAHLLATGQATPGEVLAVTFSVRAAGELRLRLAELLGEQTARGVTAATFHAVCARLVREHAGLFGRTAQYTIYDQADVRRVLDELLRDPAQHELRRALARAGPLGASELEQRISAAKNRLLTPDRLAETSARPDSELVVAAWRACDEELRRSDAVSFDDLLAFGARLLTGHPDQAARVRARWPWLLVDELQDINRAQAALIMGLAGPAGNVTAVGDEDQVIYSFRCAEPDTLRRFGAHHPGHRRIVLGRNFRSRSEILAAAVACVSHNPQPHPKALIAMRGGGGRVDVRAFACDADEAACAACEIADALAAGTPPGEILVLARTGYATGPAQGALAAAGIPHRVLGSLGLYERREVRDALAYLTLLANPADAHAFRRAARAPRRGIGPTSANHVIRAARERHGGDLITACTHAHALSGLRSARTRARLTELGAGLDAIRAQQRAGRSTGHLTVAGLMIPGGLVDWHTHRRDSAASRDARRDAERVLEDLRSLCRAAQAHDRQHGRKATLAGFLERAAGLHAEEVRPDADHRITVSTIHRSKGTEARLVALLGCEERLLPSWRALESPDPGQLAEERRLFYVAATRAKDRLLITHASTRGGRPTGGPSRFLHEAGLHPTAG